MSAAVDGSEPVVVIMPVDQQRAAPEVLEAAPPARVPGWPGLGFDPAPGRAELVGELAGRMAAVSEAVRGVRRLLEPLRAAPDGWTGLAADAFAVRVADLPTRLDGLRRSLVAAEGTLLGWQAALCQLYARVERVEQRARLARRQLDAAAELAEVADAHPDLGLDGQHFATDEALAEAQHRLDTALGDAREAQAEVSRASVTVAELVRHGALLSGEHRACAQRTALAMLTAALPAEPPRATRG